MKRSSSFTVCSCCLHYTCMNRARADISCMVMHYLCRLFKKICFVDIFSVLDIKDTSWKLCFSLILSPVVRQLNFPRSIFAFCLLQVDRKLVADTVPLRNSFRVRFMIDWHWLTRPLNSQSIDTRLSRDRRECTRGTRESVLPRYNPIPCSTTADAFYEGRNWTD